MIHVIWGVHDYFKLHPPGAHLFIHTSNAGLNNKLSLVRTRTVLAISTLTLLTYT